MARLVTRIPECVLRDDLSLADDRGRFVKIRSKDQPGADFLEEVREVFWSWSRAGTVRGLHVQGPVQASRKVVFVTSGRVFDVVLDLRRNSPSFGVWESFVLEPGMALDVPIGCAHGFQALEDAAMVYLCDQVHFPDSDGGVRFDSVGIPWPMAVTAVSPRDRALPAFGEYESLF